LRVPARLAGVCLCELLDGLMTPESNNASALPIWSAAPVELAARCLM